MALSEKWLGIAEQAAGGLRYDMKYTEATTMEKLIAEVRRQRREIEGLKQREKDILGIDENQRQAILPGLF